MDNITEFFKEFKSRLTNPLFVSFIISWALINWRVPIGILGYRLEDLKIDGYTSYADLVSKNASTWNYLWHPLLYALGYTFIFPVIRMFIIAFLNYIKKKSDNWNAEIMKDYYVPMSRFVKQKEKYDELAQALNKIYTEDSVTVVENEKLKVEALQLNESVSTAKHKSLILSQQLEELDKKQDRLFALNDVSCIVGRWQFTWMQVRNGVLTKEAFEIAINSDEVLIVTPELAYSWGKILLFSYDSFKEEIGIVLEHKDYQQLSDSSKLGDQITIDVHKVKIRYRAETDIITDMEGTDIRNNLVQYIR